jgi:amino acid transporter
MDKIKKAQIGLFLLGIIIFGMGTYVIFTFKTFGLEGMILSTTGVGVALSGFRYQQREKRVQRQKVELTFGRIVVFMGLIIFFLSLGLGLIAAVLDINSSLALIAFVFCFLIGIPIILVGGQLIRSEEKKEKTVSARITLTY